ncbi:MAG: FAD-dependent oxidoreductase [Acidobacteria bacterium]|nr:FAD-dependent oxidoreductase [Acidobacteriota bacterium]
MKEVLIVGGGLAGLASGVALAEAGYRVQVLERRSFLGGRAYSFIDKASGDIVDNGQHLMMGCYRETFKFFSKLGTLDKLRFQNQARVDFLDEHLGQTTLLCPSWPAPLHLLGGLFKLKGIGLIDKLRALLIGGALQTKQITKKFGHLTVDEWLNKCKQSKEMRERFWDPFSIATLNEDPKIAPATLLVRVLQQAFAGTKEDSTMVTAKVGLSELYTEESRKFIESRGGKVLFKSSVTGFDITDNTCQGVILKTGETLKADFYISAVPYFALNPLLPKKLFETEYFRQWKNLKSSPIISIYLWFDRPITELGFAGMLGTRLQWLFNKDVLFTRAYHKGQLLTFVISAAYGFTSFSKEKLVEIALEDLRKVIPKSKEAKLLQSLVIKEQNATFSASLLTESVRPENTTPIKNFFLAGDWTNTGLPATIEGAVLSGHRCAQEIIK